MHSAVRMAILSLALGCAARPSPRLSTRSAAVAANETAATVVVDFSHPLPLTRSMIGLLHGLDHDTARHLREELIRPLHAQIWRGTPGTVPTALAASVGSGYDLVLSDLWGYPADHWPRGRPYERLAAYEELVRQAVTTHVKEVRVWEIWNEPDAQGSFWEGDETEFFQTYLSAYRIIREVAGPSALVAGPSLSVFDEGFLKRFATFCVAHGCEANVLTWHEMGAERPLSTIAAHLRAIRHNIMENRDYATLAAREIHITEAIGPYESWNPAASLTYLQYLEIGGADASARACWPDAQQVSGCAGNSLDGLLTPGTAQPRSVWWAYKMYADGAGSRVQSMVSDERFLALASRAGEGGSPQVLLGYSNVNDATLPAEMPFDLTLDHLDRIPAFGRQAQVEITVSEIPDTEDLPLPLPTPVSRETRAVVKGEAHLRIPRARANAVYAILVRSSS